MDEFPPRGSGIEGRLETPPRAQWASPDQLGPSWDWRPGQMLLGRRGDRLLGIDDDRHVVTVAGARAGKSSTVLIPNLLRYPGSVVVIDPKGELAAKTAAQRRAMGHDVHILDPFGETNEPSASFNPVDELGLYRTANIAADAALLAEALIIANERDPHWTDAAKNFLRAVILYLLAADRPKATLRRLRATLHFDSAALKDLLKAMAGADASLYDGVVRNVGTAFLAKMTETPRELQSILSTAQEQTAPLDDIVRISEKSDFRLADLRRKPTTIYLVLPGARMGTHARWLRMIVQLVIAAMEQNKAADDALPVWLILEEFASLGYLRSIETAAGFMAGFKLRMFSILQDCSQLSASYPKSWETFLGNAGIIQAFGNVDVTTTEHLSRMMGTTSVLELQNVPVASGARGHGDLGRREHIRSVRLLEASEITYHFARETNRQLILSPGRPPIYMERLDRDANS